MRRPRNPRQTAERGSPRRRGRRRRQTRTRVIPGRKRDKAPDRTRGPPRTDYPAAWGRTLRLAGRPRCGPRPRTTCPKKGTTRGRRAPRASSPAPGQGDSPTAARTTPTLRWSRPQTVQRTIARLRRWRSSGKTWFSPSQRRPRLEKVRSQSPRGNGPPIRQPPADSLDPTPARTRPRGGRHQATAPPTAGKSPPQSTRTRRWPGGYCDGL